MRAQCYLHDQLRASPRRVLVEKFIAELLIRVMRPGEFPKCRRLRIEWRELLCRRMHDLA